jgi:hypothetical protein
VAGYSWVVLCVGELACNGCRSQRLVGLGVTDSGVLRLMLAHAALSATLQSYVMAALVNWGAGKRVTFTQLCVGRSFLCTTGKSHIIM